MTSTGGPVVARERLYLTRDKTRAVSEGDPAAWTLFCTPGSAVPRDQAARYGLLDAPEPEPAGADQQGDPEQADDTAKSRTAARKPRTARTKPRTAASKDSNEKSDS